MLKLSIKVFLAFSEPNVATLDFLDKFISLSHLEINKYFQVIPHKYLHTFEIGKPANSETEQLKNVPSVVKHTGYKFNTTE